MEKEKAFGRNRSVWSFFGLRSDRRFFLWRRTSPAGFTLVELVVVVAVIGILSAVAFAALDPIGQMQKGWDAQRKSDLSQIQKALEAYYGDSGRYPANSTDYKIVGLDGSTAEWGREGWTPYMARLPKDPLSSKAYIYYSTGQAYYLYASLERGAKDPKVCPSQGTPPSNKCPNVPTGATCGDVCNYGVTSPNVSP